MTCAEVNPCRTAYYPSANVFLFVGGLFSFGRRIGRIKRIVVAVGNEGRQIGRMGIGGERY